MPQQFIDWARLDCIKASVTSVEKKQNRITAPFLFEQGLVQIPKSLRGKNYFVFDMNGRVVQKGIAEETIRIPIIPAVLKLGKRQLFLLK